MADKTKTPPRVRINHWGEASVYVGFDIPMNLYKRIQVRARKNLGPMAAEVRRLLENALDMHDEVKRKLSK